MSDWLENYYRPWYTCCALMEWRLVAVDNIPWVILAGIGDILSSSIEKPVLHAAGDQAKTVYSNLQICAGLESVTEGEMHAVWIRREKISGNVQYVGERTYKAMGDENKGEVKKYDSEEDGSVETEAEETVEGWWWGEMIALGAIGMMTQESEPGGTTLVDSHNGSNELRRLTMLWTLRKIWELMVLFVSNC